MRPLVSDVPEFYRGYLNRVEGDQVYTILKDSQLETEKTLSSIPEELGSFKYAEGKWTIKELIQHVIDAEVVFTYRALWIARKADGELLGFEQDDWIKTMDVENRSVKNLAESFTHTRNWSISLFNSLNHQELQRKGIASGHEIKAIILPYLIVGHGLHHIDILKQRYL